MHQLVIETGRYMKPPLPAKIAGNAKYCKNKVEDTTFSPVEIQFEPKKGVYYYINSYQ
jgi:hypothetical protein